MLIAPSDEDIVWFDHARRNVCRAESPKGTAERMSIKNPAQKEACEAIRPAPVAQSTSPPTRSAGLGIVSPPIRGY